MPLAAVTAPRSITAILAEREWARSSFFEFCDYTHLRFLENRRPAPLHDILCRRLQNFVEADDDAILLINLPPAASKTLFAARLLPAWLMGRHPRRRIVTVSNKLDLAEGSGRAVRDLMSSPAYRLLFPDTRLSTSSAAAAEFETTIGGGFLGLGVDGKILGRRADFLILDDVHAGYEEAGSPVRLRETFEKYKVNLRSRLNPGGKIIVICQRLARLDIVGEILDEHTLDPSGRRVETLIVPMECVDPDTDPLGRALGENCWPAYYTDAMVADYRRDDFIWRTMCQQQPPSDAGSWVSSDEILNLPVPASMLDSGFTRYITIDLAYSVNKGDHTVFLVVAIDKITGIAHVVYIYRAQVDSDASSRKLLAMIEQWHPVEVLIDDDVQSMLYTKNLATNARATGIAVPWRPLPIAGKNKELRASPLRGMFKSAKVSINRNLPGARQLIGELLMFPNTDVDDGVDALSLIGRRLDKIPRSKVPEPQKKLPYPELPADDYRNNSIDDVFGSLADLRPASVRPRA